MGPQLMSVFQQTGGARDQTLVSWVQSEWIIHYTMPASEFMIKLSDSKKESNAIEPKISPCQGKILPFRPEVIKLLMLNSTEHGIYHAHKC